MYLGPCLLTRSCLPLVTLLRSEQSVEKEPVGVELESAEAISVDYRGLGRPDCSGPNQREGVMAHKLLTKRDMLSNYHVVLTVEVRFKL